MGVSVHIIGIKEPTEEYLSKREAYAACERAAIPVPKELLEYFDHRILTAIPDDGIEVDLGHSCVEGEVEYDDGAEIDLSKLPDGVTRIRVYMS